MSKSWSWAGVLVAGPVLAALHWGFDEGPQGWMVADLSTGGPYHPPVGIYSVSHHSAGGCAGGYISRVDPSSQSFSFMMPVDQLPEGQAWAGGRLDFCLRSTHQTWTSEALVVLAAADGTVLRAPIPMPTSDWSTYRLDLLPAAFRDDTGLPPEAGRFNQLLGQLEAVYILAEYGEQVQETTALDEVRLRPACPDQLEAPVVNILRSGTAEQPRVDLVWAEVPGAWSYAVWRAVAGTWGQVAETPSSSYSLSPPLDDVGALRVSARCE